MVKLSVVMGVYDGGGLLQPTLDSIYAQTFADYEIVLVDDGSAIPVVVDDPRVRVLRHQANRGLTRALIDGCAAARGEYIARHDAGDLSLPTRFEKQAALLDANPALAFVSCHTEFVGPELERLFVKTGSSEALNILDVNAAHGVIDGPTAHGAVMFRRDAYERAGEYRAAFYYGQDWDLWYRLAEQGSFQNVPEVLYRQRVTPGAISAAARGPQMQLAALSVAALRARKRGESDAGLLAEAAKIGPAPGPVRRAPGLYFIGEALRRNGDPRARKYLRAAVAESPLFARAWVRLLQSFILR